MSNWDKPGVAAAIESYWASSAAEINHRAWLSSIFKECARAGSVLEAGCGTGRVYEAIRQMPSVRSFEGVDSSARMLETAAARFPSGPTWRMGNLLALAPRSADTVLCFDVLGHIEGDLIKEFRSLIGAARDTAIVSLWGSPTGRASSEDVCGVSFPHVVRKYDDIVRSIYAAVPDCHVIEQKVKGDNVCYVIRRRIKHTVIVGSYNRPNYIKKAIGSVLSQDYPEWQLIVTDDGSTDETLSSIRQAIGNDARCYVIVADRTPPGPRPNGNVRAVDRINDAIPMVDGDIVHYLPDDDWFFDGRLSAFNDIFRDPNVKMAFGILHFADGDEVKENESIWFDRPVDRPHCVLDHAQVAHRSLCFRTVPKWPTKSIKYAADGVFYDSLCKSGFGPIYPIRHKVCVHRRHGLNLIATQTRATDKRE
jgi:SAM-dependent methyltransferase